MRRKLSCLGDIGILYPQQKPPYEVRQQQRPDAVTHYGDNDVQQVNILADEGALGKTSLRLAKAPGNIGLTAGEGNLSRDCVVNISQILVVRRSRFASRIGVLPYNTRLRQTRDFA